jgi:16S rRNA C967 or C1407 C5-methylase (RsmB/RsmF family)/NOL1/NOP2/fmu family ribosome biogenesis protein
MDTLPESFKTRIASNALFGQGLIEALQGNTPVSVRMNPSKKAIEPWEGMHQISWCQDAYHLKNRPSYVRDPLFHAGTYYPQEAGSMSIDWIVRQLSLPEEPVLLDLCAAPGGKSTLLMSYLNGKGTLVANEVIPTRANILLENCTKWGGQNVLVTQNDPADFEALGAVFDLVLVDAPCSGEGMFRKDPSSVEQWTPHAHIHCAVRQNRILDSIVNCIKQDGYLVYSTCTFHEAENEQQVQRLLKDYDMELVDVDLPQGAVFGKDGLGFYCLPSNMNTEGFYCAVLRNRNEQVPPRKHSKKYRKKEIKVDLGSLKEWVEIKDENLYQAGDTLHQLNEKTADILPLLLPLLRMRKTGTCLGNDVGKGWIPSAELALDTRIQHCYPKMEVELAEALNYLRGETFSVSQGFGFRTIVYEGVSLGFVKVIGNRFNNLYPKPWRIRMRL